MTLGNGRDELALQETAADSAHGPTLASGERPSSPGGYATGTKIGRFTVVDRLGEGGMGVVVAAFDPDLDRRVAIKLLRDATSDAASTRFLREARAMAKLSHPSVLTVHEVGKLGEVAFIAMEYAAGGTLTSWLRAERRPTSAILERFIRAARGLAAAHDAGMVHRDFKPDNVLLTAEGKVRVADFGLVHTADAGESNDASGAADPSTSLTLTGSIMGTPVYMAPEQHAHKPVDARADQFAFCVSLYEALYGTRPFSGDSYAELARNVQHAEPAPPPEDTAVPSWIYPVLVRGLAKDPNDRYPSMTAVIQALEADPQRRRRKQLATAGAVVAIAVVGGLIAGIVTWQARRDSPAPCETGTDELVGVWDAGRKQAVRTAFLASGKPLAADAFASVSRQLDSYTKRWVAMRTDSCEATRVRGTQSQELLDLRMECLQRELDGVRALVDVLAAADGDVVSRAANAPDSLSPVEACADADALRAPVRPPADAKIRARVDAAQKTLAMVHALWIAGRYAEASTQLAPVLTEARTLGWRPLEGDALWCQATLAETSGDYASAEKLYKAAANAAEAGRDDWTAARARISLVWVIGERLGRYGEAIELAHDAAAKLERIQTGDLLEAKLDQNLGAIFLEQGKYKEAEERARRVLEIREKRLAPDDPAIVSALGDLADVATQQGRFAESIALYRRALQLGEKVLGPDHNICATLHTNLGAALRETGKTAEALQELRSARAIDERVFGARHPEVATIAVDVGNILLEDGHPDEAAVQYREAAEIWTTALGADHPNVATAQFHLGEVAVKQGHPHDAIGFFQRALDVWQQKLGAEHPSLAAALAGLGDAALAEHRPADALAYYQRGLQLMEKAFGPTYFALDTFLLGVGKSELALGDKGRAVAAFDRSLAVQEPTGDPIALASDRFQIARAIATFDPKRARALATEAQQAYAAAGELKALRLREVTSWLQTQGQ